MKRLYRKKNNALVYLGKKANQEFWDSQWTNSKKKSFQKHSYVSTITKEYLKSGSTIIEGGCGRGNHVYSLSLNNFNAIGIDYADKTVISTLEEYPELDIRLGDVRNLDIGTGTIDGYWSLGVIEHFFDGYSEIASEIQRVLKSGGYIFLTFPTMSYLRKMKVKFGLFEVFQYEENQDFYQYCLDPSLVIKDFESLGFSLVHETNMDGFKGLKDESPEFFKKFLQIIYDSDHFTAKIIKSGISKFFSWYCGHVSLLILKKTS